MEDSIEQRLKSIDDTLAVWAALELVPLSVTQQERMKEYLEEKAFRVLGMEED